MTQLTPTRAVEEGNIHQASDASHPEHENLISVKVLYFAALRERAGKDSEVVTGAHLDARALYIQLKHRYQFQLEMEQIRVAIDGAFAQPESSLRHGQEIAFLPPVSGG